ncbi:MAG: ABC transporter permease subunit [Chryseobacterium sp.]|jgi:ABC-type transport system involved in multi-copper enzyme maturation permease subunit|uniref:ABC transporter permease/M1 family aminopeptidase n=1 Tax=Chryseobacterium sp. TaxID=1871047 RepID=UPI0028365C1A|nr:M1 family aminopeptidase [Chryseobacterium sp.]MDR2235725.1 ABC transporter permease subunit [Chryseobacterium sp.]
MNPIFLFEAGRTRKRWHSYLISVILLVLGLFCGSQFNLSVGKGIYLNSAYTTGFMTGMLSLSTIFFAVIYALQMLFKEQDSGFDQLLFSFPISKQTYLTGKFGSYFLQTFLSFVLLIAGFLVGQIMRTGSEIQPGFNLLYYLYPLLIFGLINSFLVCSFLFFVSFTVKRKLVTVAGGLMLYVLYMVVLIFSKSPFMAGSLPQSPEAQQISALADPFGLSSYFFEAVHFSVKEKNNRLVPLSGYLLWNRILFILISAIFLFVTYRLFSFTNISEQRKQKKAAPVFPEKSALSISDPIVSSQQFGRKASFQSVLSFAKIDLTYLFKSIAVPAVVILLLFAVGMEMYAEIEKGIRLPQKYAESGLMATTISENFHLFGLLVAAYFINDLYWRSHSSGFTLIESSTFLSKSRLAGHFLSITLLLFFFTLILMAEGIAFQGVYQYLHIDWNAYLGVFLFNTFPLILFSAFILIINDLIRNKFIALGISVLAVFILSGPASGKFIPYPLLRIFSDFKGTYSDFNGYGIYTKAFAERLLFGTGIIAVLWSLNQWIKNRKFNVLPLIFSSGLLISGVWTGMSFMKGYIPEDQEKKILKSVQYEKKYRSYENLPQPEITDVTTEIWLSPSQNSYQIEGTYTLINPTGKPIDRLLIRFSPDLETESAQLTTESETLKITEKTSEIRLKQPLKPGDKASLDFRLRYRWYAVNGHESFNAIIENGSFMRISRYYPSVGYQKNDEIEDKQLRKIHHLTPLAPLKKPEAPEIFRKDFINLDMTVSTEKGQTAIGTGDLVKKWTVSGRNYFRYQAVQIPFRFAVSSAFYHVKNSQYKGISVNIFYHPQHFENVDHLMKNARLTLDYCILNFGKYPFKTVNFAEVSSFTSGFAATAYPSAIFMPEDMVFHANIRADKEQDVINELAGHELSHLWWGNSQIDPDDREGAAMLTETLAMYTEMMLYQKLHGKEKMKERLRVHQQIYEDEKGFSDGLPLYRTLGDTPHISYSKGAVVMVKLSELLGEDKVNTALKNFLHHNRYPKKPSSLDLIDELYKVCPNDTVKKKVDRLFKTI